MFRIACFLIICSSSLFAQNLKWSDLVESGMYKTDREIKLAYNKAAYTLKANETLKLLDFRPLPMINVFLGEFKILSCSRPEFASEMILVDIEQPQGPDVSVGVDMAKNCVLEVFLENKDYGTISIFK